MEYPEGHYRHPAAVVAIADPEILTFFHDDTEILRVANASDVQAVAYALVKAIQEGKAPIMRALGHGAIGQVVKAQIVARGLAAPLGLDLVYLPAFDNVRSDIDGRELSVVVWRVLWR